MDGAGRFGRGMAGDSAGERKLFEEAAQTLRVLGDRRVDLGVGALQVGIGDHARAAMAWTADEDRAQVTRHDDAIQVQVDEVEPWRGAPVAEQPRLGVLDSQGLAEERIVEQVDLTNGQVVRSAPVGVHAAKQIFAQRAGQWRSLDL